MLKQAIWESAELALACFGWARLIIYGEFEVGLAFCDRLKSAAGYSGNSAPGLITKWVGLSIFHVAERYGEALPTGSRDHSMLFARVTCIGLPLVSRRL